MEAIRKVIETDSAFLTIDLPENFRNRKIELIILPIEAEKEKNNLSKFFGKLQWKGDALAEQKKLRDEWE